MNKQLEALIAEMKTAAEKATPGEWIAFADEKTGTCAIHTPSDKGCGDIVDWPGFDSSRVSKKKRIANAKHIALSNPKNIKALIAALEQSKHESAVNWEAAASLVEENEELKRRIAGMEASHKKLREAMAAIHNTVQSDGASASLSVIRAAARRAHEESATIAQLEASPLAVNLPPKLNIKMAGDKVTRAMFSGHNGAIDDCAEAIRAAGGTVSEGE